MSNKNLVRKIILPYAEALIELTGTSPERSEFEEDIKAIYNTLTKSDELKNFLANPLIHRQFKKEVIRNIFLKQIDNTIINFISVIVDKKRVSFLQEILQLYFELILASKSSKIVHVYTVTKLTLEQQNALIQRLQNLTNSKTVQLNIVIDTSLIAGLMLKVDSKVIDLSVYGQLKSISKFLQAT